MNGRSLRKIGILGGMGPEATILLMSRILMRTPAEDDSDHIPLLVDSNTQVPSRIKRLIEGTGADPGPVLASMAAGLQRLGAEAIAMPCNTAHHYANDIVAAVDIPLLNMVDLTVDQIARQVGKGSKVGLLASPAVRLTGLYERAFANRSVGTLYPKDERSILDSIRQLKRSSKDENAVQTLQSAARELIDGGASCIAIACSEFSLVSDRIDVPVVDSVDVLADAVVSFSRLERAG